MTTRKGSHLVDSDEQPQLASPEKIPHLKPAFREGGTVTAANSSSISDGAAALGLASRQAVKTHGLAVRARICAHAGFAHAPGWFTTAPVHAARKLVNKLGWQTTDVDIWEVNEAFAVVAMAFIRESLSLTLSTSTSMAGHVPLVIRLGRQEHAFWSAC